MRVEGVAVLGVAHAGRARSWRPTAALGITVGGRGRRHRLVGLRARRPAGQADLVRQEAAGRPGRRRSPYVLAVGGTNLTLNARQRASPRPARGTTRPTRRPSRRPRAAEAGRARSSQRPWWQPAQSFASSQQPDGARRRGVRRREPGLPDRLLERRAELPRAARSRASRSSAARARPTPLVAGMIALWTQQAQQQGLPRPGFVPPLLYSTAKSNPGAFVDITAGHQRAVRRIVLPRPAGLRPGDRARLAHGESDRRAAGRRRLTVGRSADERRLGLSHHRCCRRRRDRSDAPRPASRAGGQLLRGRGPRRRGVRRARHRLRGAGGVRRLPRLRELRHVAQRRRGGGAHRGRSSSRRCSSCRHRRASDCRGSSCATREASCTRNGRGWSRGRSTRR